MIKLLLIASLLAAPLLAAPPSNQELQTLLSRAASTWGQEADGPVTITSLPMNPCDLSLRVTPDISIMEWSALKMDGVILGRSYFIRINSNCDWSRLPLFAAVMHEYGHVLIGAGYHSKDKHSVMSPVLKIKNNPQVQSSDRKQLETGNWLQ